MQGGGWGDCHLKIFPGVFLSGSLSPDFSSTHHGGVKDDDGAGREVCWETLYLWREILSLSFAPKHLLGFHGEKNKHQALSLVNETGLSESWVLMLVVPRNIQGPMQFYKKSLFSKQFIFLKERMRFPIRTNFFNLKSITNSDLCFCG